MFRIALSCVLMMSLLTTCSVSAAEPTPAKTIAIVNAAGLSTQVMAQVAAFASQQLHVPVRTQSVKSFQAKTLRKYAKKLKKQKQAGDVCLIGLVSGGDNISLHASVEHDLEIGMINVGALKSEDPSQTLKRVERHVMRSAGFLFGLVPAPDPHCVTRHYRTLADLDTMGMNFCPPWQGKFAAEARKRGLPNLMPRPPLPRPPVAR